jgi:hypothetical protein
MVQAIRHPGLYALLLIGAAATAGCSRHRSPTSDTLPATTDEGWSLTVVNRHWLDVSVYVMSDGQRARVGTVSATRTETYELPAHMIRSGRIIRLEANPIGATRVVRTDPLAVQQGQHVEWTLETGLERSSVAIW